MKNLKDFIVESSISTKIKSIAKDIVNDIRKSLGKKEKTYRPYISIDRGEDWATLGSKQIHIWSAEGEYLFQKMKEFLDATIVFKTKNEEKNTDGEIVRIEYSYSDKDESEVREIWDKLCKVISETNDELTNGEADFNGIINDPNKKKVNKELSLWPEEHKKYKIDEGKNWDHFSTWEWYWVEMFYERYPFYPGAMFHY